MAFPYKGAWTARKKKYGPMQDWQNAANAYGTPSDIKPKPSIPSRSGDDVVGPNRPPTRSGDDTPDYTLTIKLGSIKRRYDKLNNDEEQQKKKKAKPSSFGGM